MIGLYDPDGSIPNNAFLKLTRYAKESGEPIEFIREGGRYKTIYASAILTSSKPLLNKLVDAYPMSEVLLGGPGWILGIDENGNLYKENDAELKDEIEKLKPDYSLYTFEYWMKRFENAKMQLKDKVRKAKLYCEAGVGFTRRGCRNKCVFCGVRLLEPIACEDQEIKDILNPKSNKLILLDNDFSEDPNMVEKSKEIIEMGLEIELTSGINIRTITDEQAYWISKIKHIKQLKMAWDNIKDEERVMNGLKTLNKYMPYSNMMCYVLIGEKDKNGNTKTTLEEDLYRVYKLQELGVDPYVMVYNDRKDGYYHHLERWCQSFVRRSTPFEEYVPYKNLLEQQKQVNIFEAV